MIQPPLTVDFVQDESPQFFQHLPVISSHQSNWKNIHLAHHHQPEMHVPVISSPQHIVIIPLGHDTVDIEHVSEGHLCRVLYETNDYVNNCIQIFPAELPYKLNCLKDVQQLEFIHCYLEPEFLAQVAHESINPDKVELLLELKRSDRLIYQIGIALRADLELDGGSSSFYADSLATALAAHLLKHYSTRQHSFRSYDDGLSKAKLKQAIEYINDHLYENFLLGELAKEIGMSQYYFCRLFKRSTGVTPHQYLIGQRIERSKQLLRDPERTITEVAEECGFSNPSHFAKYFGKYTGLTPKQFRKL